MGGRVAGECERGYVCRFRGRLGAFDSAAGSVDEENGVDLDADSEGELQKWEGQQGWSGGYVAHSLIEKRNSGTTLYVGVTTRGG